MTLLIDGDILLYRVLYTYQAMIKVPEGKINNKLLAVCLKTVLFNYVSKYSPSKVVICCKLEDGKYFRHSVSADYKKYRQLPPKEIYILRAFLKELPDIVLYSSDSVETDDLLTMYMTEFPDDILCLSGDKDLLQVKGSHASFINNITINTDSIGSYEFGKFGKTNKLLTTGFIHICRQMLDGDKIDNILGIPGYGAVKIHRTLQEWDNSSTGLEGLLNKVKLIYNNTGISGQDRFYQNLDLVTMLQTPNKDNELVLDILSRNKVSYQNKIITEGLRFKDFLSYAKEI